MQVIQTNSIAINVTNIIHFNQKDSIIEFKREQNINAQKMPRRTRSKEAPITEKARHKIKEIFQGMNFNIEEFVELPNVTNNMGEPIIPSYEADMILSKEFVLEFDSKKLHGTKIKRNKDKWRDTNILSQTELPTVRLNSIDILQQNSQEILDEIEYQLRTKNKQDGIHE